MAIDLPASAIRTGGACDAGNARGAHGAACGDSRQAERDRQVQRHQEEQTEQQ
jgi:hypothetical protein